MTGKHLTLDGEKLLLEVPGDLDERLLATMGVTAAEMHRLLGGNCIAGTLAKALAPLVPGLAVRTPELAGIIAKHGIADVRAELREIYAKASGAGSKAKRKPKAAPPPPPPELTVEAYCARYMAGEGREDPAMLQFAVNHAEAIEAEFQRLNALALAAKEGDESAKD